MKLNYEEVRELANQSGFNLFGVSMAKISAKDKDNFNEWILKKYYGEMNWFPKNHNVRSEFENLGFIPKSAIVLGVLYVHEEYEEIKNNFSFRFSRYAVGEDYHNVIKDRAKPIIAFLKNKFPDNKFRMGVDSLPISEKVLAREAGLGWIGKHTNLINENIGSYFFLSVILTDLEIHLEKKIAVDRCGTCTACLDACPTNALFEPYKIDASKCISHHTIEDHREVLPNDTKNSLSGWLYGCDICQEVCPWNKVKQEKKKLFTEWDEFKPNSVFNLSEKEFINMSQNDFDNWAKNSPIDRIGYNLFNRNINNVLERTRLDDIN